MSKRMDYAISLDAPVVGGDGYCRREYRVTCLACGVTMSCSHRYPASATEAFVAANERAAWKDAGVSVESHNLTCSGLNGQGYGAMAGHVIVRVQPTIPEARP